MDSAYRREWDAATMKTIRPLKKFTALSLCAISVVLLCTSFTVPPIYGKEPARKKYPHIDDSPQGFKALGIRVHRNRVFPGGTVISRKNCESRGGKVVTGSGPAFADWCVMGKDAFLITSY